MLRVLIIGLWGFPGGWHRTRYKPIVIRDKEKVAKLSSWDIGEGSIEAHSTTVVMAKVFSDLGYDVYTKIYGLDTLASPPRMDPRRIDADDVKVRLVEKLNEYVDEFVNRDPESYSDVVERARKVLELFVYGYVDEVDSSLRRYVPRGALKILPGIGAFSLRGGNGIVRRYIYRGSPLNTYAALQLDLINALKSIDPDLVVLDISHGINYLPVLGREAVYRCVEVFSAIKRKRITLAVVNSDPIYERNQEAYIHLVEVRALEVKPIELLKNLAEGLDREQPKLRMLIRAQPPRELQIVNQYIEKIYEELGTTLKAIAKASSYGLALYLVHRLSKLNPNELREVAKSFEEKLRNAIGNRNISRRDNTVVIEHSYAVPLNTLDILYALHLLEELILAIERVDIRDGFVELESLKKLAEEVGFSDIALTILDREVYNLRKSVEVLNAIGVDISRPMLYSAILNILEVSVGRVLDPEKRDEVLREAIENGERKRCSLDKRHFYAHAGMERNVVEVFVENGRVFIGYATQCLDTIDRLFMD